MAIKKYSICLAALSLFLAGTAEAQNCGWSKIDHQLGYDESGIWNPSSYRNLMNGLTIAQVVGALWEGSDSRLGLTMWQGIDSQIIGNVGAQIGKHNFRRERPPESNNPCNWFSDSNQSFPSGEATNAAALVTPYILEYGEDHPMVYGLFALPLYVGVGRLKAQAHWQTDVLAGWALGAAAGYYAHSRDIPILVSILPHGITVGIRKQF
jgi:undecaprenyl-diphosphatase